MLISGPTVTSTGPRILNAIGSPHPHIAIDRRQAPALSTMPAGVTACFSTICPASSHPELRRGVIAAGFAGLYEPRPVDWRATVRWQDQWQEGDEVAGAIRNPR